LFVYEISREPLNGFAPNSHGRRVWSLARTSLKVNVNFGGLRTVYVRENIFALVSVNFRPAQSLTAPLCGCLSRHICILRQQLLRCLGSVETTWTLFSVLLHVIWCATKNVMQFCAPSHQILATPLEGSAESAAMRRPRTLLWRRGVQVTTFGVSTRLLYVGPG